MVSETPTKKRIRVDDDDDEEAEFEEAACSDVEMNDDDNTTAASPKAAPSSTTTINTQKAPSSSSSKEDFSPVLLSQYYSRLFPFQMLHSWLSYDPSCCITPAVPNNKNNNNNNNNSKNSITKANTKQNKIFSQREFSFTLAGPNGQDIYIRYQSFLNHTDLSKAILKRQPIKIDIGAVFNHPPKDVHAIQSGGQRKFHPQQRELVFDVDLTDYDGVRNCGCSGAQICHKCWDMMTMAMKVMDEGLREDFGFQHVAWFYSGRRGVHAWVCDEAARKLTDHARAAVATYFEVNLGSEKNQNIELTNPLHPTLERARKTLEPMFIEHILPASGHGILSSLEECEKLLSTLPPAAKDMADTLLKKWTNNFDNDTPAEKWEQIQRYIHNFLGKTKEGLKAAKNRKKLSQMDTTKLELWSTATIFKYTYPRLDINVSKMQNHLLKSPFCVHPKTGRVCVPIDIRKVEEFDPFAVPTLGSLMKELDEYDAQHADDDGEEDKENGMSKNKEVEFEWEKTSLKESFHYFRNEVLMPMWKDLRREERNVKEEQAALVGDW